MHCSEKCIDRISAEETNRGRREERMVKTYQASKFIRKNWHRSKTIIYVRRTRKINNKLAVTHSYYLSSLSGKAKEFAKGIRHHWGIENRLHYVKDVTLKEDASKIKRGNAPGIMSLIRNLIINVARINGENRIRKFMRQYAGNITAISLLLE